MPILEQLAAGDEALRARGEEIMRRHERDAIANATLADGCVELLACLGAASVPCAILTRNIREVVESFVRKFDLGAAFAHGGGARPVSHDESAPLIIAAYTREDGPPKPAPDGVLHLCRALRRRARRRAGRRRLHLRHRRRPRRRLPDRAGDRRGDRRRRSLGLARHDRAQLAPAHPAVALSGRAYTSDENSLGSAFAN